LPVLIDMKVLVIDNDGVQSNHVAQFLKSEGHWCEIYHSPAPAQEALAVHYYDVIVYNIALLDQQELDLLRFLRQSKLDKKTVLTFAPNTVVTLAKMEGLGMVTLSKPYTLPSLDEQLNRIIRNENLEGHEHISFNKLVIDIPGRMVTMQGEVIGLTRREYDLLLHLALNKNKVISKNTLARYLSTGTPEGSDDFSALYVHVKNLKKKLKAAGCQDLIETVYGIGYRLTYNLN
jgi:DNA-binding response OmpR family regulator